MKTSPQPPPAIDLSTHLYYQLVYTLTDLLPPPLDDTPEALNTRNRAAIAKVAALQPVNANEADLAAQCIAARAQGEDVLRLLRQNAGDIGLVMRLNAQYGSMVRTSLSVLGRLIRVQAVRQKREATEGAVSQDAWTLHVAERSMAKVVDPHAEPPHAAVPEAAPAAPPAATSDQGIEENVSENTPNSQDTAFETRMREQPWNQRSTGSHINYSPLASLATPSRNGKSARTTASGACSGSRWPQAMSKPRTSSAQRRHTSAAVSLPESIPAATSRSLGQSTMTGQAIL